MNSLPGCEASQRELKVDDGCREYESGRFFAIRIEFTFYKNAYYPGPFDLL